MDNQYFEEVFEARVEACRQLLVVKGKEYVGPSGDRLSNFKAAAVLQSCTPARALTGFNAKHIISIYDMIAGVEAGKYYTLAQWNEKIGDALNYLFLLNAVLVEEADDQVAEAEADVKESPDDYMSRISSHA